MINQILLDMDGVLCDFFGASLELHGRPDLAKNWPKGEWEIANVLGISVTEFWEKIDAAGHGWWANLPHYEWTKELVQICQCFAPVVISTTPSRYHGSASGKVIWLQRFFGDDFHHYMLGGHKHLMAKEGVVLVDDSDRNITKFVQHDGWGVLFPQPWNSGDHTADKLEVVRQRLIELDDRSK